MYILSPLLFPRNLQILLSLSFSFPFVSIYLSPLSFMDIFFFSSVRPPNITFFLISFFHLKSFPIFFFYFILSSCTSLFAHIPPPTMSSEPVFLYPRNPLLVLSPFLNHIRHASCPQPGDIPLI